MTTEIGEPTGTRKLPHSLSRFKSLATFREGRFRVSKSGAVPDVVDMREEKTVIRLNNASDHCRILNGHSSTYNQLENHEISRRNMIHVDALRRRDQQ